MCGEVLLLRENLTFSEPFRCVSVTNSLRRERGLHIYYMYYTCEEFCGSCSALQVCSRCHLRRVLMIIIVIVEQSCCTLSPDDRETRVELVTLV